MNSATILKAVFLVVAIYILSFSTEYFLTRTVGVQMAKVLSSFGLVILAFAVACSIDSSIINRHGKAKVGTSIVVLYSVAILGFLCVTVLGSFYNLSGDLDLSAEACSPTTVSVVSLFQTCIASPLAEELIFTGFLYGTFRKERNILISVFIVSLLFALLHAPESFHAVWVRFLGMTLACLFYEKIGILWPAIIAHMIHNSTLIVVDGQSESICRTIKSLDGFAPILLFASLLVVFVILFKVVMSFNRKYLI